MEIQSLLNLGLRGLSVIIKFLLSAFLARELELFDFGQYSLITATVSLCSLILGLEYFNYNARVFLARSKNDTTIIGQQIFFHLTTYLLLIPVSILFFGIAGISFQYLLGFLGIIILDHWAQEIVRILIVKEKPVHGTFLFFIKSSLWFVPLFVLENSITLSVQSVLLFWLFGALLSFLTGLLLLNKLVPIARIKIVTSMADVKAQFLVAFPFFLSALMMRGLFTFDKYFLNYFEGEEMVGVISLFFLMALILQTATEAAISSIFFPRLVKAHTSGDRKMVNSIQLKMIVGILAFFLSFGLFIHLFMTDILDYLNKADFYEYKSFFYWYLVSILFLCLSLVPHYKLYAFSKDKLILAAHTWAFVSGMILYAILGYVFGTIGLVVGFGVSTLLIWLFKEKYALKLSKA